MKTMLLALFLNLQLSFASENVLLFQMRKGTDSIPVSIVEYNKLHLTKDCLKGSAPKCLAFEATKKKGTLAKPEIKLLGDPASRYCHGKQGVSRILESSDKKQYDYCLFSDGSMIDSWDLYYLHFSK